MHTMYEGVESLDEIYLLEYKVLSLVFHEKSVLKLSPLHTKSLKITIFHLYGSEERLLNLSYEIAAH